ncbi:MAG: mechanosensitive ion channel family protein [Bryobacterales bacterium]|nr:mechanosensitive ion channel family protein [Bryobacterales bacterium]
MFLLLFQLEILSLQFWEQALSPERILDLSTSVVKILVVLVLAAIVSSIVNRLIPKVRERLVSTMQKHRGDDVEMAKRAVTVSTLFRRTITALIWVVAIITALQQAGFDIAPILATAGVAGLAISFGAQNLVRDVISGVIILLENQIRVGDVAQLNGTGGLVEDINLRTVRLRSLDGTVHIFPNGSITTLANLTNEFSFYLWDLGVAYKEDTDYVVSVVKELAAAMRQEEAYRDAILDDLEVLGVDQFGDDAVIIKMRIKTKPIQQWMVGRELNRRIKKRFDELGIEIPFPHRTLYLGAGVAQELAGIAGRGNREGEAGAVIDRTLLKEVVREVLMEMRSHSEPPALPEVDEGASSPDPRQRAEKGEHETSPGGE